MAMKPRWDPKNRRWEASLGSGKDRIWFRCKIEGEAGLAVVEAKVERFLKPPEVLRPGSLSEFVETVWWPVTTQDCSYRTKETYRSILENHFDTLFPRLMSELRIEVLQPWIDSLMTRQVKRGGEWVSEKRAPKTVRTIVAVLTSIMEMAHRAGRLEHRDHTLVRTPKLTKNAKGSLDSAQVEKLLAVCSGTVMEGPVWAAAFLGLRRGEVLGLKVGHVQLLEDRALVNLQDNRQQHGEDDRLKSKASGEVRQIVAAKSWGEKLLGFALPGTVYVFSDGQGKPVQPHYLTYKMASLCKAAGVPRVSFHSLRHSCASNLRGQGVPESVIQGILGHSKIDTTLVYLDKRADEQLRALGGQVSKG